MTALLIGLIKAPGPTWATLFIGLAALLLTPARLCPQTSARAARALESPLRCFGFGLLALAILVCSAVPLLFAANKGAQVAGAVLGIGGATLALVGIGGLTRRARERWHHVKSTRRAALLIVLLVVLLRFPLWGGAAMIMALIFALGAATGALRKETMKLKTHRFTPMLIALAMSASLASAQPDTRNAPKAANPPAWPQMGDWQNMTPAQRQEAMKKFVDQTLRDSLTHIGVVDEKTQTTILQFAEVQEKSKQTVRDKAHKVGLALLDNAQTEAQIAALMKEFRQATDDAKAAQKADVATLEELTGFSKKPKLQAFLTMMGLISDETLFLHGVFGNYLNALSILAEPPAPPPAKAPQ